jgi:hypothetical protein
MDYSELSVKELRNLKVSLNRTKSLTQDKGVIAECEARINEINSILVKKKHSFR